jgi:hypothetical protein
MACGCSKRGKSSLAGDTLGYRVTLPDGTVVPPADQAPFFSVVEAKVEVRSAGGGTIRREVKNRNAS